MFPYDAQWLAQSVSVKVGIMRTKSLKETAVRRNPVRMEMRQEDSGNEASIPELKMKQFPYNSLGFQNKGITSNSFKEHNSLSGMGWQVTG